MTSNESMFTAFKPLMDDTKSPFLTPSFSAWLLALGGEATTSWGGARKRRDERVVFCSGERPDESEKIEEEK